MVFPLAWLVQQANRNQIGSPLAAISWQVLTPDSRNRWLVPEHTDQYAGFLGFGDEDANSIFKRRSLGVSTNRDSVVYDFSAENLAQRIEQFCEAYDAEVDRLRRSVGKVKSIDEFVDYGKIKWSSTLKGHLQRGDYANFDSNHIRPSLYRPFTKRYLYYSHILIDRPGQFGKIYPVEAARLENQTICVPGVGNRQSFGCILTNTISNLDIAFEKSQCFPFYVYNEDGSNRRENITDWALKQFREHYNNRRIDKWAIFYYVYGLLHHPGYRSKYADNLKRELPRIPYAPDFKAFSAAGKKLADLHLNYETVEAWGLDMITAPDIPLSYKVEKMRLNKEKTMLRVNDSIALGKIPAEAFEYRLGNRSALEWVVDQYRVKTDERSGIVSDPNNGEDEKYIVELVGRVTRVSVETVKVVKGLPEDFGG